MTKCFIFLIFLSVNSFGYIYPEDSLKLIDINKKLLTANDTNTSNLLNDMYGIYLVNGQYSKTIETIQRGIKHCEKVNFARGKASFYVKAAKKGALNGRILYAFNYFQKAKSIYDSLKTPNVSYQILSYEGFLYYQIQNYDMARKKYLLAIEGLSTNAKNYDEKYDLYSSHAYLGNIARNTFQYNEAMERYKIASDGFYANECYESFNLVKLNKAELLLDQNLLLDAKKIALEVDNFFENTPLFSDSRLFSKALLARIYDKENNNLQAYNYSLKFIDVLKHTNSRYTLDRTYKDLSNILIKNKDFENACLVQSFFIEIKDSLMDKKVLVELLDSYSKNKILEVQSKNNDLIQENIRKNELILAQKENQFYYFIASFLGVLLTIFLFIFSFITKKKSKILKQKNDRIVKQNLEIEESNKIKNEQFLKLQSINKKKDEMVKIVSHDLKAPLNRIVGLTSILNLDVSRFTDQEKMLIGKISDEANEELKLIDDLLNLAALESHKTDLQLEDFDVVDFSSRVVESFMHQADEKGIQLRFYSEKDHFNFKTDKKFFHRILDNYITNAIKYSPLNSKIDIDLKFNSKIILSVKDSGAGIKKEELNMLFKAFQKISNRPTGNEKSNGIGLSIVKEIADILGGRVYCESEENKGSIFYFEV